MRRTTRYFTSTQIYGFAYMNRLRHGYADLWQNSTDLHESVFS